MVVEMARPSIIHEERGWGRMTPQEIIQYCERQLMLGSPNVVFLLPGKWGKRNIRRLWPSGPEGEIVSEIPGRGICVMFDAKEVMEATNRTMKTFGMLESEGEEE